jgi:phage tail-like protein
MSELFVNPHRFDPYQNFKFRVKWDGHYVAGVSRVSGLRWRAAIVELREGGEPDQTHLVPGAIAFEPITLERGITDDKDFEDWARQLLQLQGDGPTLAKFRKDIVIEIWNAGGSLVRAYTVHRCWVSEYQALPDLDANAQVVFIERLVLQNEGWERDTSVSASPSQSAG